MPKSSYDSIPQELRQLPNWVCWKRETRKGKATKVPYAVSGTRAKADDPGTWATFDSALSSVDGMGADGIGFELGLDGAITFIDLDHVIDKVTHGQRDDIDADLPGFYKAALDLCGLTYSEVSVSGDGLHLFFRGPKPGWLGRSRQKLPHGAQIEVYDNRRYAVMTGDAMPGPGKVTPIDGEAAADKLDAFLHLCFEWDKGGQEKPSTPSTGGESVADVTVAGGVGHDLSHGTLNTGQVLDRMRRSKNWDSKIRPLYEDGDLTAYNGDHSSADQALCNQLAFYSDNDPAVMDELFRGSKLMRPKWDELHDLAGRRTYGQMTIDKAIKGTHETASDYWRKEKRADLPPIDLSEVNDRCLSARFARTFGDVRYVSELRRYAVYCDGCWQVERGDALTQRRIKTFVSKLQEDTEKRLFDRADALSRETGKSVSAILRGKEDDMDADLRGLMATEKALHFYDSQTRRSNLFKDIRSENGILCGMSDFDQARHLLNVSNGTLDLSGDKPVFRPHDPRDMITRMAPVTYDPKATCPTFERVVADAFYGDVELIRYFRKLCGIIVAGETKEDKFLLCGLANRAGKDTVFGALGSMLGYDERSGYACVCNPSSFAVQKYANGHGPTSDQARWQGRRLIMSTELSESMELDCDLVKRLSSGRTPIEARRMRENEVTFVVDGIVVLLANVLPDVRDQTLFDGDRPVCIPFEHHLEPDEIDKTLRERVTRPRELSGILNWALHGLRDYRQGGLGDMPDQVREMGARFRADSDAATKAITEFVRVHVVEDNGSYIRVKDDLFEAFKRSEPAVTMKWREFSSRVRSVLPVSSRKLMSDGKQVRNVVVGMRLA